MLGAGRQRRLADGEVGEDVPRGIGYLDVDIDHGFDCVEEERVLRDCGGDSVQIKMAAWW